MSITILHNPDDEASRRLVESLGVELPAGTDVTVTVDNTPVRIVSDHAAACAVQAQFPGYPTLVYAPGESVHVLPFPADWQACLDYMAAL